MYQSLLGSLSLVVVASLAVALAQDVAAPRKGYLQATVERSPTLPLGVRVTLFNPGKEELALLKWHEPAPSGKLFHENFFSFHRTLSAVDFQGYRAKVLPPPYVSKADFTFFPAGENRTFDVDVAQNYHFRRPGRHVVRGCPTEGLARLAQEAVAGASHNFLGASEIDCEESRIVFEVSNAQLAADATIAAGSSNSRLGTTSRKGKSKTKVLGNRRSRALSSCYYPSFSSCSSDQENIIKTSWNYAIDESGTAQDYMDQGYGNCETSYYTKYFGTYSSDRWKTVQTQYAAIAGHICSGESTIECAPTDCSGPSVYAYVNPSDSSTHTINVCGQFWKACEDEWCEDSDAGTFIHETSHFYDIAGTEDIQYGESGCEDLAKSNPDKAVQNADSHEYFCEQDPAC